MTIYGKSITINDRPFTIIGVLPSGFDYPSGAQVWTATFFSQQELTRGGVIFFTYIARIHPSLSFSQAARQYNAVLHPENLSEISDSTMVGGVRFERIPDIQPLRTSISQTGRKYVWLLFGSGCLVTLIAVTNVIGHIMARMLSRQREFSIRYAHGASRLDLLRQLLVEHTLLAVVGGGAGLLVAVPGVSLMKTLLPAYLPRYAEIGIDMRVLLFTLGLSIVIGIFSGLVAAFSILRTHSFLDVRQSGEQSGIPGRIKKWRSILIFAQTALALTLLSSSGLLLKNFLDKLNTNWGFNPENLLALTVSRDTTTENSLDQKTRDFYFRALDNLRAIPRVESVGGTSVLVMNPRSLMFLGITTEPVSGEHDSANGVFPYSITPGFFKTMGTGIIYGRDFTDWDTASSEKVVIINEALARKLYPDGQGIGTGIFINNGESRWNVVGVVASAQFLGPGNGVVPEAYFPYTQWLPDSFSFIVRAAGKSPDFAEMARKAIHDADSFQPIEEMDYIENYIARHMERPRSLAALISIFALLGYALVLLGVYGTITQATNGRIREYGIRLAMGAEPRKLWLKATLSSLPPLLAGITAGTFLAWYVGRLLQSEVPGVSTGDPVSLILFSLALIVTALATGAFASRRILLVDPIIVLRHE